MFELEMSICSEPWGGGQSCLILEITQAGKLERLYDQHFIQLLPKSLPS